MAILEANVLLTVPNHPRDTITIEDPATQAHSHDASVSLSAFCRFTHALSQMDLASPVLVLTPWRAFGCMTIFGLILLTYGIAIMIGAGFLSEFSAEFTHTPDKGTVAIPITYSTNGDLFIYIKFENMYQNVQWYTNSLSQPQLASGNVAGSYSACLPWSNGSYPCGLVSASLYTDAFTFRLLRIGAATSSYLSLDETSATISTILAKQTLNPVVIDYDVTDAVRDSNPFWLLRYFPPTICRPIEADSSPTTAFTVSLDSYNLPQCTNFNSLNASCIYSPTCDPGIAQEILNPAGWGVENSHVRNWLATSSLPTMLKLWAKILVPLYEGDVVYVDVRQNWHAAGVTKTIVICETNWQGGPSLFLPICLMSVGFCYILAAAFMHVKFRLKPRVLGDVSNYRFADESLIKAN